MSITCPTCAAIYRGIVAKPGQKVRCSRCDESWRVPAADGPASDPATIDVAAVSEKARPPSYEELYGERPAPSRAAAAAPKRARRFGAPALAVVIPALAMAAVGFRAPIVKTAPATGSLFAAIGLPVNLKGLEFRNVKSVIVDAGGQKMLGVEGEIANLRPARNDVPQLELAVRGPDGRTIYSWTTGSPKSKLEGLETVNFRARLAAPPDEARDVRVTFAGATRTASR